MDLENRILATKVLAIAGYSLTGGSLVAYITERVIIGNDNVSEMIWHYGFYPGLVMAVTGAILSEYYQMKR